jgi:hypothetical protein
MLVVCGRHRRHWEGVHTQHHHWNALACALERNIRIKREDQYIIFENDSLFYANASRGDGRVIYGSEAPAAAGAARAGL